MIAHDAVLCRVPRQRLAELQGSKLRIERRVEKEIGVTALRDDTALLEHDNAVGLLHGSEAVSDDQRGAILRRIVQRPLHQPFAGSIERAGGLVKQQDRRILQDRACDRDALMLSAKEPYPTLTEKRVVALRQFFDKAGRPAISAARWTCA